MQNAKQHEKYAKRNRKLKGFTLIEILLVLSIITIIAMLGVGSYSAARRMLAIDLETDRLISIIHSLREETRSKARCFGLHFEKNKVPEKLEASFRNPKQGCDPNAATSIMTLWNPEVTISNISVAGTPHDAFSIFFIPPKGNIKFEPSGETFGLSLALKNHPANKREITINSLTGTIEKKSP